VLEVLLVAVEVVVVLSVVEDDVSVLLDTVVDASVLDVLLTVVSSLVPEVSVVDVEPFIGGGGGGGGGACMDSVELDESIPFC
jgi:hypothetical protein